MDESDDEYQEPVRNPDGTITVPSTLVSGDITGDGVVTLSVGDPGYDSWDHWIRNFGDRK